MLEVHVVEQENDNHEICPNSSTNVFAVLFTSVKNLNNFLRVELGNIVRSMEKIYRDGKQLIKGGSNQPSTKQLQQRVGLKPSLEDCLKGLRLLCDMHRSE